MLKNSVKYQKRLFNKNRYYQKVIKNIKDFCSVFRVVKKALKYSV